MSDIERLIVALEARTKAFENAMAKSYGTADRRARAIETRFARMNKVVSAQFAGLGSGIGKAFAAIGGAAAFQGLSDSATKIRNALSVAGLSGRELEATFDSLYASAQRNSAPIESLTELYSRVALNQKELGVTSQQLIGLTDNVGKALRVSGADAQSASGALLQLAQALGSNKIQAEEYGSLIDGLPALLQAAANGIVQAEGSVSKLTQLVKAGRISNKAFFDGIEAGAGVLDERLAGATQTVAQRYTNLQNALVKAADRFNRNTEAADALGGEFSNLAEYIDRLDFTRLVQDLSAVLEVLREGSGAAQGFAEWLGKISGLSNVGGGLVDALGGENGKVSYFGGLLTIESTVKQADRLNDLASQRLAIEKQIAETRNNQFDVLGPAKIKQLEGQLSAINAQIASTAPPVQGGPLVYDRFPPPAATAARAAPVDITDDRYKPADDDDSGKRRARLDDYAREIEQIRERTAGIQAETAARSGLNPLVDDYGFAVEKAAAKQDLLTAAQRAGKTVTPELAAQIDTLSTAYANAVVESEKLADSQERIREKAEEARNFNKELTRGIIDGWRSGKEAADVFADALSKISDRLLDMSLNAIFDSPSKGGLGFNPLSFLGDIFRANGGPVKKNQPYVVGEKRAELFVPDQNGTILPSVPTAPTMPDLSKMVVGRQSAMPAITYSPVYNVTGTGEEIAQIKQQNAQFERDFAANVLRTMRKARKTMDWR